MGSPTLIEVELIHGGVIAIIFFHEEVQANPQIGVTQNALVLKESDHTDRYREGGEGIGGKSTGCLEQGRIASEQFGQFLLGLDHLRMIGPPKSRYIVGKTINPGVLPQGIDRFGFALEDFLNKKFKEQGILSPLPLKPFRWVFAGLDGKSLPEWP
jgi:hypothetical protein